MNDMWDYTVSWADVAPVLTLCVASICVALYHLLR